VGLPPVAPSSAVDDDVRGHAAGPPESAN